MKIKKNISKLIFLLLIIIFSLSYLPVFANNDQPEINSAAAVLIDSTTNKVLFDKNANEKMYPASMTKILTAILTIENCDLNEKATASHEAIMSVPSGYSIADIKVGETLTIDELLQVLLVHSANDAANVLAEHVSESIDGFATLMNTKALEIGCKNSHFVNPSGKHDDDHYTTPYDMALIMKYCMKNETFRKYAGMRTCTISSQNTSTTENSTFIMSEDTEVSNQAETSSNKISFSTTNFLLLPNSKYYYKYAVAGKTGFTTEAKNCLVSVSNKDGFETICVVMGADSVPGGESYRFHDSITIFDYIYNQYAIKTISKQNDIITNVTVPNATSETKDLDLLISEDITVLIKQSDIDSIKPEVNLNSDITAPISQNQVLGTVSYTVEGVRYTTSLLASHTVEKSNLMILIIAIGLIVVIILILVLLIYNKKNKKNSEVLEDSDMNNVDSNESDKENEVDDVIVNDDNNEK